jgi:hypothetical protein
MAKKPKNPLKELLGKPDQFIGVVLAKHNIQSTVRHQSMYVSGDSINIAYSVMTPCGQFYRVMGSSRWLSSEDVEDFNKNISFVDYRFKPTQKDVIIKPNQKSTLDSNKSNINHLQQFSLNNQGTKIPAMNKTQIRNIFSNSQPGDEVTIAFAGEKSSQSGTYKFLKSRRGRGKGGSLLAELQAADGSLLTTGTPDSDVVINIITPDGQKHGLESEKDIRLSFKVDISRAVALKEQFKTLQASTSGDTIIDVDSTEPAFSGKFKIVDSRQLRGSFGQIILDLVSVETGVSQSIWSYRHSGIITRISVL